MNQEPSESLKKFAQNVYDKLDQNYNFDPFLIIAIVNITINIVKVIMYLYFTNNSKKIQQAIINMNNPVVKLIMRREIKKECPDLDREQRKDLYNSIVNAVHGYGESEFKDLVSSI